MGNNQTEKAFEEKRLAQTISLAEEQLKQAKEAADKKKSEIIEAKKDVRENTEHGITSLYTSDGFEALVELSQYINPVTDKIIDYEEEEHKILLLEKMIKSPYFARIDFKFDDEDEFEKIYIGRSSLRKNSYQEMYVYDWRSPIASVFYRFMTGEAFYDAPCGRVTGELNLKRQYEIKNGTLEYFFDSDVQIVDEFLRQLLSQNTTAKMKAIVETIQHEQDVVIRDMENDLLMVQGVAGSGKTSIALHRAAYLMYQGLQTKLSANNIMIISPNSIFEQYISNVLPELGEDNVISSVFEDILSELLNGRKIQSRNDFLENLIVNSKYKEISRNSIEFKTSSFFREILDQFLIDIPRQWIEFEDVYYEGKCVVSGQILKDKILGRPETPLGIKLEQLEDYILEQIFGTGKGRGHKEEKNLIKQEIQKFIKIDIVELYKILFSNEAYFYSLLQNSNPSQNIKNIWKYTKENLEADSLYYDDAIAIAYLYLKIYGTNKYKNIKQVVIDEAQDYYPLQYEIFNLVFSNAKFTILGDMKQTLAKKEDISFYEQIQKILNKKKSSLIMLDKSFRCTNEILNFSLKFIEQSSQIKSFNRNGDSPKVYIADNSEIFIDEIVKEIKLCQEKGFQSICLICKTEKNSTYLFNKIKHKLDIQLIKNGSASDLQGVFILPVYMSKGLEFDTVLICDADSQNYYDEDDKNLLYVACTRALHKLSLFCENEVSPLI
ncbi:HelD family protein [Agathobacter rectalis]|jgi:DNA helicase-2/ATP-dependent DNA helicase PcrA|uniref:ATP-binding domain-containing protein n=1 Tax=Agathobacter rectalis TaxID=39491 RepID=A0AAW4WLG8_9FIRM|nr:3'-5' exonuclease [Agathobacter rectalis]MCC2747499.1 ATP-binding domain-containing protein [Agathobacter rectalis]NSI35380.1 ATP-binding domain-containing protein [Agathobacter rectalis]NSI38652.1 ATP-binding domain-containing protein [Agathobacter rectalis]NSI73997.1 ATP-binding domain-containing protein [Agathobacter rectalis]NSI79974.1 ATP-binding domain-containing protein [Agathobacter rectalis]